MRLLRPLLRPVLRGVLAAGRTGAWSGARLAHGMVVALLAVAVLAAMGTAGLAWRLSQGPLDVTVLARWAEKRAHAAVRVEFGRATVAWAGFEAGAGRALEVRLEDVRLAGAVPPTRVADAAVDLSLAGLLGGRLLPRAVQLTGVRVQAARPADDGPDDATPDAPGWTDVMAALRRPADKDGADGPALRVLGQLREVRIRDAVLDATDPRLGPVRVAGDAEFRRADAGGVSGTAALRVALGGADAQVALRADLDDAGGTRVEATASPLDPASLARAVPALAPLQALEGRVSLVATAELTPALRFRSATLRGSVSGGRLRLPSATVPFDNVALDAAAAWDPAAPAALPQAVTVNRLQIVLPSSGGGWPTTLVAAGDAARAAGRVRANATVALDHLAFADLGAAWPAAWGGQARPWIVQNITAGMARDGQASLSAEAAEDGSGFRITAATASLQGDDATISWLRPVPPVEHAQAMLTMREMDTLEIAIPTARQGTMQLSGGLVRITGLSKKDQDLSVAADVGAGVPELLSLLKHPRLKLLDKSPLPIRDPAGTLAGKLFVTLPLEHDLTFEQVGIHATARINGLRLGGLVAKRDLDRGDVQVDVTQDGLRANGAAALGGIPGQFAVELDFRGGPPDQVVQHATMTGRATPRQLAGAGLDAGGVLAGGAAAFKAEYTANRDGNADVELEADLRDAALSVAGWKKAPGAPARAAGRLLLWKGDLQGIDGLEAHGPGMDVSGRAEMVGDLPSRLVLERIVLGPTRASGQVELPPSPGAPIRLDLSGAALDLSNELSRGGKGGKSGPDEPGTPLVADLRFDRVLLAEGRSVSGVTAHAEYDGKRFNALRLQTTGPERIQAVIARENGGRRVSVRAADGGAMLQALDVTASVRGGSLAVEARYDDARPGSPLSGTADLSDFHVKDAVVIGKVLQAATVYGIADALNGPGLAFSRLILPFRWEREVLEVSDAQAFSASLGLTAKGRVDVGRRQVDMAGTIVPAYALNSALGRLPFVGRLFSPERGGGLVAVDYTVRGPLGDPAVAVNPLSALTPGFLRRVFRIFD